MDDLKDQPSASGYLRTLDDVEQGEVRTRSLKDTTLQVVVTFPSGEQRFATVTGESKRHALWIARDRYRGNPASTL